jgi:hypothetical protein
VARKRRRTWADPALAAAHSARLAEFGAVAVCIGTRRNASAGLAACDCVASTDPGRLAHRRAVAHSSCCNTERSERMACDYAVASQAALLAGKPAVASAYAVVVASDCGLYAVATSGAQHPQAAALANGHALAADARVTGVADVVSFPGTAADYGSAAGLAASAV